MKSLEGPEGKQELPERTTPPIEKYGKWGLMRCSAEIGTLQPIDVVRMIDALIAAEAEVKKLSALVDEKQARETEAVEELAKVREELEKSEQLVCDFQAWG